MTKNISTAINRRDLLSTAALGAVATTGALSSLSFLATNPAKATAAHGAGKYWTKSRIDSYLCAQIHQSKSMELGRIIESSALDDSEKNLALRTAHCPTCGVHIQPTNNYPTLS